jgi:predicted RNA polymerase sigma factor
MPHRRSTSPPAKPRQRQVRNFRQRYDDLEARRIELVARLHRLSEAAKLHPGYKRALKLLNDTYRREKLAQRLAVLQAASWLIGLLEELTSFI